jgi:hypothetical protein
MLSAFSTPEKTMKYRDGSFRFVCNDKISVGQTVQVDTDDKGKPILKKVISIEEERKSKGVFKNENDRCFSFRLTVE